MIIDGLTSLHQLSQTSFRRPSSHYPCHRCPKTNMHDYRRELTSLHQLRQRQTHHLSNNEHATIIDGNSPHCISSVRHRSDGRHLITLATDVQKRTCMIIDRNLPHCISSDNGQTPSSAIGVQQRTCSIIDISSDKVKLTAPAIDVQQRTCRLA